MFKKNESYKQIEIFAVNNKLNKNQQKLWDKSKEHLFFKEVFCKIDEDLFSVLYSEKLSRPNVPVNQLVGALILKHLYNWTYEQLFQHLNFNILTRHAIGINKLDEQVFCEASIFNFQNKLINHNKETGEDLIDKVFCHLTKEQIKKFGIDTTVQRGDSFLVGSNIVDYSRLQLLIEILIRLNRELNAKDKKRFEASLKRYVSFSSSNYIFNVQRENLTEEFEKIGILYNDLDKSLGDKYKDYQSYKNFKRVLKEQFDIEPNRKLIKIKDNSDLYSDNLKSPDDLDATYRKKGSIKSIGFVTHISETVNSKNKINLITDVVVEPNNVGDELILKNRLPKMKQRTPNIKEYFVDGMYGSPEVDEIANKKDEEIKIYQSKHRGRKSKAGIEIYRDDLGVWVICKGNQEILTELTAKKRHKAVFDLTKCERCPFKDECNLRITGGKTKSKKRVFYFSEYKILAHKRMANIKELTDNKKYSRANVEATVKEVKRGMKNGKVRIRGKLRVSLHMIFTTMAINATRIWSKTQFFNHFLSERLHLVSQHIYELKKVHKIKRRIYLGFESFS